VGWRGGAWSCKFSDLIFDFFLGKAEPQNPKARGQCWRLARPARTYSFQKYPDAIAPRRLDFHLNTRILARGRPNTFGMDKHRSFAHSGARVQ